MSILSPGLTSICRGRATSNDSGRRKSSAISFLEAIQAAKAAAKGKETGANA
jgi:hypothetical protein